MLAGARLIGRTRDIGVLLNAMQRKDKLKELAGRTLQSKLTPAAIGWHCKLTGRFGYIISGDQP